MYLAKLTEYLSLVPDVVWSGLIASLLTLSGVLISNASNTGRLKAQLSHDSAEKAKERTGKLRQEVYLLVAEELGKANNFLGSLASIDLVKEDAMSEMRGLFSSVAKLQLVAEPATALLVSELSAKYGAATLRLLSAARPLMDNRVEIDLANKFYDESLAKTKHYQSVMTELVDSGQADMNAFKLLETQYEFHEGQRNKHAEERNALWEQRHHKHLDFVQVLISEMKPLSEQFVAAMIAIRSDLGQSAEQDKFASQMTQQWAFMEQELNKALGVTKDA